MTRAITEETYEYVLKADRELPEDDPGRPVFRLRHLTPGENAKLQDNYMEGKSFKEGGGTAFKSGTHLIKTLQMGLVGWRNLNDANGTEVPFPGKDGKDRNALSDREITALLGPLQQDVRRELVEVIVEDNNLSEEQAKN